MVTRAYALSSARTQLEIQLIRTVCTGSRALYKLRQIHRPSLSVLSLSLVLIINYHGGAVSRWIELTDCFESSPASQGVLYASLGPAQTCLIKQITHSLSSCVVGCNAQFGYSHLVQNALGYASCVSHQCKYPHCASHRHNTLTTVRYLFNKHVNITFGGIKLTGKINVM